MQLINIVIYLISRIKRALAERNQTVYLKGAAEAQSTSVGKHVHISKIKQMYEEIYHNPI